MCGCGVATVAVATRFAVWLVGVGWVTNTCAGGATSDRLRDAMWFYSEDDALASLLAGEVVDVNDRDAFVVVSL